MSNVRLVARTLPIPDAIIEYFDYGKMKEPGGQDLIAYCARVSNPSNQENLDTANKLLSYCMRNKHWSPFEMVNVVLEINTTRDIARQILRHRSFSFQEFSQRYADPTQLGFVVRDARLQDHKNRQNSIEEGIDPKVANTWYQKQHQIIHETSGAAWTPSGWRLRQKRKQNRPGGRTRPGKMHRVRGVRAQVPDEFPDSPEKGKDPRPAD